MTRFLGAGAAQFWNFLMGPVVAALVWFIIDVTLRGFFEKNAVIERFFSRDEKLKPYKGFFLTALRIVVASFFIFTILALFNIDAKPLINIDRNRVWDFLSGPVFTVAIWFVLDHGLRHIFEKSAFIESMLKRHSRVRTFKGLFLQIVRILLGIYFIFILLDHFKIDPKPLLAGIGVVGLGLSLAAQNILRDFLNGLFIVIEDQFNVGDWVTIGDYSGTVERFTMRVTRLRASDGRLITIPNGNITQIVNSTKNFGVAMVEVGVSYSADARQALKVLEECAEEVARDMPRMVIDKSQVQGILDFRDNDVLLRVVTKTAPGDQWAVERAMRLVIKEKFDANGIDIPFQQVVIHQSDS